MSRPDPAPETRADDVAAWRALATLYNALLTGTVLGLVSRRGAEPARELVFRLFRRQHLDKFLPGLKKLGLDALPDAVACARYHYHSNALGGVHTEYVYQSDRKAWVRYPPPRWMWKGTAITGIPHEVSAAMLHGWHGHNGVSLGNPRLGFVCTGMTVDGQPGLEGYYVEHEHALAEHERIRFAIGKETMPPFDRRVAPALEAADWPEARRLRTHRSYAMAYVTTLLPVAQAVLGAPTARAEIGRTARLIGLQFHEETAAALGLPSNLGTGTVASAEQFAHWLESMLRAQGERLTRGTAGSSIVLRQDGWRLMDGAALEDPPGAFDAWQELWAGACAAHDRFLTFSVDRTLQQDRWTITWRIAPRA